MKGFLFLISLISVLTTKSQTFVEVRGLQFYLDGEPYRFVGANLWNGMHLGAPESGDQERLIRELDRLQDLHILNLRVMACSDGPNDEPWRVSPVLQFEPGSYDNDLLLGLDFLLFEMSKRNMKAVICLTNFWPWTGGMAQYRNWSEPDRKIPYPPPAKFGSWVQYQLYTAGFYRNSQAIKWYHQHIEKIISRTNACNGREYRKDPTIMSWELANEPRAILSGKKYRKWITTSANLIKSIDSVHLVTIGSEGNTPSRWSGNRFELDHTIPGIDYCTIHIWVENWGWYNPSLPEKSFDDACAKALDYLSNHMKAAIHMGKPLVLEEFGLARDFRSYDPRATTKNRDLYFHKILSMLLKKEKTPSPLQGANVWAWAGEGSPVEPGQLWENGDILTGDPPHEHQGWYSIYAEDHHTNALLKAYADKVSLDTN